MLIRMIAEISQRISDIFLSNHLLDFINFINPFGYFFKFKILQITTDNFAEFSNKRLV